MGKQNWGLLPQLKSQPPPLQPQVFAECCSNLTPCSGDRHPSQKRGTWLGLQCGLLPPHNDLPFHSQCPQVCTWITENTIQFTSFELWLPHGPRTNSSNRAGNEIMSVSSKWNRCNLDSIYKSQMTCGLNLKTGKMLNCVVELRSGRR